MYKKVSKPKIKNPIVSKPFIQTQISSNDPILDFYMITVIFFNFKFDVFNDSEDIEFHKHSRAQAYKKSFPVLQGVSYWIGSN